MEANGETNLIGIKLIVNCLPLTAEERAAFVEAAAGIAQEFVGDESLCGAMSWKAVVPESLRAHATAVIGNIPAADCAQYPELEWLQTWSAGVDAYCRPGRLDPAVALTNASGAYGQSVSEHMFAMMWALMRDIPQYSRNQAGHVWRDCGRAASPCGALALIIGTGDIGGHFAKLCKGVGMRTYGVRRDPSHPTDGVDAMYGFKDLDALLPQADVVALCVPSTPQTHHLLDAGRLALLGSQAVIVNAGRGDAIDPDALAAALHEGGLRGAGLDVTEPEPLPESSPLWDEPRCLITPHVAGGNHLAVTETRIIDIALDNVRRYAAGRPLANLIRRS